MFQAGCADNLIFFNFDRENNMDNETVVTNKFDKETIAILLDDRFATGG